MDIFERIDDVEVPVLGHFSSDNTLLKFSSFKGRSIKELVKIFSEIPSQVISLNLSDSELNKYSIDDLATIFAAIPSNVNTLILNNTGLNKKTEAEWIKILTKLSPTIKEIKSDPDIQLKITAILKKVQEQAFKDLTSVFIPEVANLVLGYATHATYFNYKEESKSVEENPVASTSLKKLTLR